MKPLPSIQLFNESSMDIPIAEHDAAFLLKAIETHQNCRYDMVEVAYVNETEIIRINQEFLARDYVTDIISFRYDEDPTNQHIEGTLYCCAPRIHEQAKEFANGSEKEEFLRVLIHGLIHLIGYNDQTPEEKAEMTRLEDHFLAVFTQK